MPPFAVIAVDPDTYMDIIDMPDPVQLTVAIHIFNYHDATLYFKVTGSHANWTIGTESLGGIASGANARFILLDIGSRTLPSAALDETITLTVSGYTDAGYTNLYATYNIQLAMHFIKSDDGSWTLLDEDNFDTDASVEDWAHQYSADTYYVAFGLATDYALSAPNSIVAGCGKRSPECSVGEWWHRIYKTFVVPACTLCLAIINARHTFTEDMAARGQFRHVEILEDSVELARFDEVDGWPDNVWLRFVVPLTPNGSRELSFRSTGYWAGPVGYAYERYWFDDIKVIYK